jgi:hypothetical protein
MISPSDLPDIGQTTVLLALPWKSIETPQQARALNLIGFLCCTALGILSVVFAVHVSIFKPDPDLLKGFLGSAVVFCGCAVGLRFSSRVAAIIGFVGIVFISLFALLLKTSQTFQTAFEPMRGASARTRHAAPTAPHLRTV